MAKPKKSLSKVKAKTWTIFSQYIRGKYSIGGVYDPDAPCVCFTCDTVKPIKEMQAGHGVSGRTNGVLFLEEAVRPQCVACNMFRGGMYEVFIPKLIDIYGRDGYEEFVRLKNTPKKFTIGELEDMQKEYKEFLKSN